MSIAEEITRLQNAKESIKNSMEKRGAELSEDLLISDFASLIDSIPCVVKGSFTPEEDTKVFSISGLPFAPEFIYLVCNDLYGTEISNATIYVCHGNGYRGSRLGYLDTTEGVAASNLSPDTTLASWTDDGYEIDFSKSTSATGLAIFKAGYTYTYFVAGGFKG